MRIIRRKKVLERAKRDAESKKLYSFRLKPDLMEKLQKDARKEKLSVTGLLEAIVQDYLRSDG